MKRAVIYARYSSAHQREESIEGQIRIATEYATKKELNIVGTYIDRAISGRTDKRPDFQRLINDSSEDLFDAVIVYKTDRFARNKLDSAIYKAQLKQNGIELHYAAESIPDGPEGVLVECLMEGLAEYYSLELSQKITRGMYETASKGKSIGGRLALGYYVDSEGYFQIDPKTAPIVQKIFNMFIKGDTIQSICDHLNSTGARTTRGGLFRKTAIPHLVTNEKYIGTYMGVEDAIPAIISKEVFDMAQKRVSSKKRQKKTTDTNYLLSGKLFCGECQKPMCGVSGTSGTKDRKYYYYICPRNRDGECARGNVNRDWLEELVVEETIKYVLQPNTLSHIAARCSEIMLNDKEEDAELKFYKQKLSENTKALANIQRAIETGVVTETLPKRLQELESERKSIEREIRLLDARSITFSKEQIEFMLTKYAQPGDDHEKYKERIIKCFVSAVYLYNDKVIIVYNITKNGSELDSTELEFLEKAEKFESSTVTSTKYRNNPLYKRVLFFPYTFLTHFMQFSSSF